MKLRSLLLAVGLVGIFAGFAAAQSTASAGTGAGPRVSTSSRAADVLKEINAFRAAKFQEARTPGNKVDLDGVMKEVAQRAKDAVKGVDAAKVDPKEAYEWAQLFRMAEQPKDTAAAAERFLAGTPEPAQRFDAQMMLMTASAELEDAATIVRVLKDTNPPTPQQANMLLSWTAGYFADVISNKQGVDAGLRAIDEVEAKVDFDKLNTEQNKQGANMARGQVAGARAELLRGAGRKAEALLVLNKALDILKDSPAARSLNSTKKQIELLGSPAPALNVERGHGTFAGLESLKGKVVILDFFAHWCGPCIRSFPDLKKLYGDYKDKGLEVVGITTYYGYYGAENREKRDMAKDVEFAKMPEFMAKYEMTWPVVFGDRTNFEAFGVSGIPHVAVVDREGKVHKIKVGYSPDSFVAFRKEIESLLGVTTKK